MDLILTFTLIAGGILAASNLIIAKKPDAKALVDKLVPAQAGIGLALLVFGVLNLLRSFGTPSIFDVIKWAPLLGIATLGMMICAVLLGLLFGMPMVGKMSAAGAAKGQEMAAKFAPFQTLIGLVGIGCSLVYLLYRFGILKISL